MPRRLDRVTLAKLAAHFERVRFETGEVVFQEGDPGDAVYVVLGTFLEGFSMLVLTFGLIIDVMKPASLTPLGALIIGDALAECDVLPEGAFSILPCRRDGAHLFTEDPRLALLSFTGENLVKLVRMVKEPRRFRPTATVAHMEAVGLDAVPLVILFLSGYKFLFGWAKPVPVNYSALRKPRQHMAWVAAAGAAFPTSRCASPSC